MFFFFFLSVLYFANFFSSSHYVAGRLNFHLAELRTKLLGDPLRYLAFPFSFFLLRNFLTDFFSLEERFCASLLSKVAFFIFVQFSQFLVLRVSSLPNVCVCATAQIVRVEKKENARCLLRENRVKTVKTEMDLTFWAPYVALYASACQLEIPSILFFS